MKRKLEILCSAIVVGSFFLPWIPYMDMISSTPLQGWYFTLIMVLFGIMGTLRAVPIAFLDLITGILLIVTFWLCVKIIIIQSKTAKERIAVFLLTWGIFIMQVGVSTGLGMNRGLKLMESLNYQLSFTCYGIYVGLAAALLLLMLGKTRVDDANHAPQSSIAE